MELSGCITGFESKIALANIQIVANQPESSFSTLYDTIIDALTAHSPWIDGVALVIAKRGDLELEEHCPQDKTGTYQYHDPQSRWLSELTDLVSSIMMIRSREYAYLVSNTT